MKNIQKYIFFTFFLSLSCSSHKAIRTSEYLYKIYKIEHKNNYYFIYCEKTDRKYKIISKENEGKLSYNKIKIGNTYEFQLKDFPDYSKESNPLGGFVTIVDCFNLDNDTQVCREKDIDGLYTTNNLLGLYYVK